MGFPSKTVPDPASPGRAGRPGPGPGTSGAPMGSLTVDLGPGTVTNRSGGQILSGKNFKRVLTPRVARDMAQTRILGPSGPI